MMYLCASIFQRFLLRVYLVLHKKDTPSNLCLVEVYFWGSFGIVLLACLAHFTSACAFPCFYLEN